VKPTLPLDRAAQAFWDRHADRLQAAGLLTPGDVDSFSLLCVTWSKLNTIAASEPGADNFREMVQLNQLLKQYQQYAREFGLLPASRRKSKLDAEAPAKKDEFGL
jgi:phage terminase small subunit